MLHVSLFLSSLLLNLLNNLYGFAHVLQSKAWVNVGGFDPTDDPLHYASLSHSFCLSKVI